MKTKVTISHDGFHGQTQRSITVEGKPGDVVQLSPSQVKKLERAACGINGCKCGESLLHLLDRAEPWNPSGPVTLKIPASKLIEGKGYYAQRG